ncbi:MAG: glycosyltransferase family 2 protein [Marinobacter sp.]|uniref:glycosyltransferase family 2 protein n=1 Tax=Marinobacter sp. TaxID=50741 RepID=UPI003299EEBE
MSDQPLVSVVIATYNTDQYLPDAVASVLAQSWNNLEVVVVDDGSEDDTPARMALFDNDERVRYIRTENRGQPKAKNLGLKEAQGDFIAFCDADDLWAKNKLEVQMPKFSDPRVGVVYSEVSYIDQNSTPIAKEPPYTRYSGKVTDALVISNFIPFGTSVIRRKCLEQNGGFDEELPMGIDWDLWLRYSVDWEFIYCPEVTYVYRIWPGQMSKNYRGRYDNAFRILRKFINANPSKVSQRLASRAWADMYIGRAMAIASAEKTISEPLSDIFTGLKHDASYMRGWKSLVKLMIRRV